MCDVWSLSEGGLEVEEVNAVDAVQEIVDITVDAGASKSVWPIRKETATNTKAAMTVRLAGSNQLSDTCGRRCETGVRSRR